MEIPLNPEVPKDMICGRKHDTKYGTIEVISYQSHKSILVRFVDTGFCKITNGSAIRTGSVKDPYRPKIFDIGYFGVGRFSTKDKAYSIWVGILSRCYNPKNKRYYCYGGAGVTVSEDWHNYQTFAKWYENNNPRNDKLEVDKDILSGEQKKYSPETCSIVTRQKNIEHSKAKEYSFISPSGEIVRVYNLKKFCRENSLSVGNMCQIHQGNTGRKTHKGWRKA